MKHHISRNKFERRCPGVTVQLEPQPLGMRGVAWQGGHMIASALGKTEGEIYYQLSERILRRNVREVAAAQGWRDARTGKIGPLSGHHQQKRSKGRLDSKENLEGLSQSTHGKQHEG